MDLRRSFSHPDLLVSENGDVFYAKDKRRINKIKHHATSLRGYIVSYRAGNKTRSVSIAMLVYELYIKGEKMAPSDYVDFIDGNEFNCSASNLYSAIPRRNRKQSYFSTDEKYDAYLNGLDELYC